MQTRWFRKGEKKPLEPAREVPAAYEQLQLSTANNTYFPLENAGVFVRHFTTQGHAYFFDAWVENQAELQVHLPYPVITVMGILNGGVAGIMQTSCSCSFEQGRICVFYRPGKKHQMILPSGEHSMFEFNVQPTLLKYIGKQKPTVEDFLKRIADFPHAATCLSDTLMTPEIRAIIREIEEYKPSYGYFPAYLQLRIVKLLLEYVKGIDSVPENGEPSNAFSEIMDQLLQAKKLIDENSGAPLRLSYVARKCRMNNWQFKFAFPRVFGKTFAQYQLAVRLERAAKLLVETDDPIQSIGLMIGYEDESSFTKRFKRVHGITPLQFRRKHVPK